MTRGQAALVLDTEIDGRFNQAASLLDAGIRSLMAAPMLDPDGTRGMIVIGSRLAIRAYSEDDMQLLASLASVASVVLLSSTALRSRDEAVSGKPTLAMVTHQQLSVPYQESVAHSRARRPVLLLSDQVANQRLRALPQQIR